MVVMQTVETGPTRTPRVGGIEGLVEFAEDLRVGATQTVGWISDPCTFPQATQGLCWETLVDEKEGEGIEIENSIAAPFVMYGGVECFLGGDQDFDTRAHLVLDQGGSRFIEAKIDAWATAITADAAVNLTEAVAQVDNTLDAEYLGRGIIFVNRGDANRLKADNVLEYRDGRAYTVNGTPVVATSAVAAGDVFGTGAIKVLHGGVKQINAISHTTNREMSIAERVQTILVDCSYRTFTQVTNNG